MAAVAAMTARIAHRSAAGIPRGGTTGRRARISARKPPRRPLAPPIAADSDGGFGAGVATAPDGNRTDALDAHVPIDRFYTGLRQLHASPDVFVVDDFVTPEQCDSIVAAASTRAMDQSPVVYAGWTNDVGDVINTAARGPALWLAALVTIAAASADGPGLGAGAAGAAAYAGAVALASAVAVANVKKKESALKELRTSTSCALDGASDGERAYVAAAEALMPGSDCSRFEAPTSRTRTGAGRRSRRCSFTSTTSTREPAG